MNKAQIKISEDVLEVFHIDVMGKEFFYDNQNYVCLSGIPITGFNFAYVILGYLRDIENIVEKTEKFFAERNTKFNVVVSDSFFHLSDNGLTLAEVDEFFTKREYSIVSREPRMILGNYIHLENEKLGQGISIRETSKELDLWIDPLGTAFEGTLETDTLYKNAHVRALSNYDKMRHYTLFVDEKPVSSITFTCQSSAAQIDDMGTNTAFQKKGYGAMLLKHSLNDVAKNFGIKTFFLNSSEQGMRLYKKFGFKNFYFLNIYTKK